MAPPRATAWPRSILTDPDVLHLDDQGLYVVCRVCAESYATRGGKKPKPVKMNARYRTPAWDTHKLRTRAHRLSTSVDLESTATESEAESLPLAASPSDHRGFVYRQAAEAMTSSTLCGRPTRRSCRAGEESLWSARIDRYWSENAPEPASLTRTLEGQGSAGSHYETLTFYQQRISSRSQAPTQSGDEHRRYATPEAETSNQQQSGRADCQIRSLLNPLPDDDDQESCYSDNEAWFIGYERHRPTV